MLISPNLLDLTKTTYTAVSHDFNTKIARVIGNYHASRIQYALPKNLVVGEEYTFSCEIDSIDGDNSLKVLAYPGVFKVSSFIADNGRQSYTFRLNNQNTHIYLYLGDREKTYGSYKIYNEKLESGTESTLYLPNENTIETAKRQYFIGGGTSRKYILSHRDIEQSSYRKEVAAWKSMKIYC